mmetsp:Transcript_11475/g.39155  ORF Transcript_11475/g.39155 Transcript_11475/m.39155 type:complete len:267 (+) Transcript_11475:1004-1804(+)
MAVVVDREAALGTVAPALSLGFVLGAGQRCCRDMASRGLMKRTIQPFGSTDEAVPRWWNRRPPKAGPLGPPETRTSSGCPSRRPRRILRSQVMLCPPRKPRLPARQGLQGARGWSRSTPRWPTLCSTASRSTLGAAGRQVRGLSPSRTLSAPTGHSSSAASMLPSAATTAVGASLTGGAPMALCTMACRSLRTRRWTSTRTTRSHSVPGSWEPMTTTSTSSSARRALRAEVTYVPPSSSCWQARTRARRRSTARGTSHPWSERLVS